MNVLDLLNVEDESVFDGAASAGGAAGKLLNAADTEVFVLPVGAEEG